MHPLIILMMKGGCLKDSLSSMNNAMASVTIVKACINMFPRSEKIKFFTVQNLTLQLHKRLI